MEVLGRMRVLCVEERNKDKNSHIGKGRSLGGGYRPVKINFAIFTTSCLCHGKL